MYPSSKEMDAVHSGTGVFYQAMPAVGDDGKNIMKLIPVQMVNGHFFQTTSKPKTDALTINIPSAPVQVVKKAAFKPSTTQQVVRKTVSLVNALPNQVDLNSHNSVKNKHPLQEQRLKVTVPPMATPATNCDRSSTLHSQLFVTVKSPALPRGQYLQIPHNAQVQKVRASELPAGIKNQIFTSSASCSPGSSLPSVLYVSPIRAEVTPPQDSSLHSLKLFSKTSNNPSPGPSLTGLKLTPKVSQRINSPIKWVIEEENTSRASTVDPLNSPSVTSEILSVVAGRENALKHHDAVTNPVSQLSPGKSDKGQENALVMCNGKVYFVAKKCDLPHKTKKIYPPTTATKSGGFKKNMAPSSRQALESVASEIRQDHTIIILDESDEVIDLCDDDAADDSSQQAASVNVSAVTHLDEDNVIFVSYIPPKPESQSAQDLKTQTEPVKETGGSQTANSNLNGVMELKSLDGAGGGEGKDETTAPRSTKPGQITLDSTEKNLPHYRGSTVMNMRDNKGTNINSQQSTSTQQLESMDVNVDAEKLADPCSSDSAAAIFSQIEEDTNRMENFESPATCQTSSLAPNYCGMADHRLKQMFHINADVRICLWRIDEAPSGPVNFPDINVGLVSAKRRKELTEQKRSADTATPTLKCSHLKLNTKSISGQSLHTGTSCDLETGPGIGYVEPIDEDFLSTDENDIPRSQDGDVQQQTLPCVDLNTNTRRMGRTRKRTVCSCCIPGTQDPPAKYAAKSLLLEKFAWTTEQTGKKGGRTKAVRKNVVTAKNKQNCSSMDADELKRQERIKRLRELLRDKEAALEVMRNSMS